MKFYFADLSADRLSAVEELLPILGVEASPEGFPVYTARGTEGLSVAFSADSATVTYTKPVELFRGIGLLAERMDSRTDVTEIPAYEELAVMFDCSRNAVATVESAKRRVRHLALMGYHTLFLYMEDTYEMEEYPYFGYMRGRYSKAELQEIDRYCARFGIELVPYIQVLAHLMNPLRWPAFREVHDCDAILLVDEPKTYELIRCMLTTMRDTLITNRVHLGMDEAWTLGGGNYYRRNGHVEKWKIMQSHTDKVMALCRELGIEPMMWSDMYFDTAANDKGYYYLASLEDAHLPQHIIDSVPAGVELIYWDYGNFYERANRMCRMHKELNNPIWFAGGATIWAGFAPMNQFSLWVSRDQLRAARDNGITKIMVTCWGDNGQECNHMAALPTIQMFAEDCYESDNSDAFVSRRFATCVGASYEDFLLLDTPNFTPGNKAPGCGSRNPSKYLLYQDVLMGLFDEHVDAATYPAHFADRAQVLTEAGERNPRWQYLFDSLSALCRVLELKCTVGIRLKAAYDAGDRAELARIAEEELPEIRVRLEAFIALYQRQWLTDNKVFGLDVLEVRFGGLERRLTSAQARIRAYLAGEVDSLPELMQTRLRYDGAPEGTNRNININRWGLTVSGCQVDYI